MCLERASLRKTASQDIICYKTVRLNMTSPCYSFQYEIGKTYKTKMSRPNLTGDVDKGFHSFANMDDAVDSLEVDWFDHTLPIDTVRHPGYNYAAIVLKCLIPKGADYHIGECWFWGLPVKGYVSNTIKILEKYEIPQED